MLLVGFAILSSEEIIKKLISSHKIMYEIKDRYLTRPTLDRIVGAALRSSAPGESKELIIRCRSAAQTVYNALDDYGIRITIVTDKDRGIE